MMRPTAETPLPKGSKGDRDENGRFLPGHTIPGPGAPYAKRVAELRTALLDAVTPEDVAAMLPAMIDKAKSGDSVAFRILAPYLLGRPVEAADREAMELPEKRPIVLQLARPLPSSAGLGAP